MIDLDRLREAKAYFDEEWAGRLWSAGQAFESRPVAAAAMQAVLDAPRTWRCFVAELNPNHPIPDANVEGLPEECRYARGHSSRCGWVVLVPVEGGPTDALVEPTDREVMASGKYPRKSDRFGPCTCHRCVPVEGEGKR